MGIIMKKLNFSGDIGKETINILVDTGASYSFIRKDYAQKISTVLKLPKSMEFELAGENQYLKVNEVIRADFYIGNERLTDEFLVCEGISEEAILGAKTMQAWKIKVDMDKEDILLEHKVNKLKLV